MPLNDPKHDPLAGAGEPTEVDMSVATLADELDSNNAPTGKPQDPGFPTATCEME